MRHGSGSGIYLLTYMYGGADMVTFFGSMLILVRTYKSVGFDDIWDFSSFLCVIIQKKTQGCEHYVWYSTLLFALSGGVDASPAGTEIEHNCQCFGDVWARPKNAVGEYHCCNLRRVWCVLWVLAEWMWSEWTRNSYGIDGINVRCTWTQLQL